METTTFANPMGQWLAPALMALRATSFFEWWVYMPLMTAASIPLYRGFMRRVRGSGAQAMMPRRRAGLWLAMYYFLCFLLPNVLAVAVKTMIIEEMDYPTPPWFAALVSPLHFYIASAVAAYLWLIARARRAPLDWVLGVYVQIGILGGYAVAVYRLFNEPWDLTDPTSAVRGVVLVGVFLGYNWDLVRRLGVAPGVV